MSKDPVLGFNLHQLTIDCEVIYEWSASYSSYESMWKAHSEVLTNYFSTPFGEIDIEFSGHRVVSYVLSQNGDVLYPKADNDLVY
ncbi:hypothetical protein ACUFBV_004368 [Vibrio harveyi]